MKLNLQNLVIVLSVFTLGILSLGSFVMPVVVEAGYNHHKSNRKRLNIVETAQSVPSLSTLVGAVVSANLVDTLASEGPFTVFAPDNDAFAAIEVPSDISVLTKVLTYHVVAGSYRTRDLHHGQELTTVNGEKLTVIKKWDRVKLKTAKGDIIKITQKDVKTSNGIVHLVNKVMLP